MSLHISYIAHCNALCCLFSVSCWVKETNDLGEFTLCLVYSFGILSWKIGACQSGRLLSVRHVFVLQTSHCLREIFTQRTKSANLSCKLFWLLPEQGNHPWVQWYQMKFACSQCPGNIFMFSPKSTQLVCSKCSPDQVCMQSRKVGKVSYSQGCLACAHISRTDTTSPTNGWKSPPHHSGCVKPGF